MAETEPWKLESGLSEVAIALFAPGTAEGTLRRIVDLAVASIDGCDAAGVFVVRDERVVTSAFSDPVVVELDGMQFEADQGPCLDAVSEGGSYYSEDLAEDERWPRFGSLAVASGFRCVLAFRLSARHLSALNLYARLPSAFSATDRATGSIFATLAGIALDSAEERDDAEKMSSNLRAALESREMIGQAQGILMERERITADQAFDVLRRASQHLNLRLREVAQTLVDTGETPAGSTPAKAET